MEELKKKINGSSSSESNPGKPQKNNPNETLFSPPSSSDSARSSHGDHSFRSVSREAKNLETPVSAPALRVQSTGEPVVPYSVKMAEAATSQEPKSVQVISLDEIQGRWKEFVEEIRKQRIHVGTLLSESRPLGVDGGIVRVGCRDEFHLTTLKRSKDFLVESAHRVYGKKVRIEISLSPVADDGKENTRESSGNEQSKLSTLDHPVIKALMRELGAEPLQ